MTDVVLLDGGMGQELVKRSGEAPTPLWATQVMIDHPGLVQQIHEDFFDAGATVATTNTYALHHDRIEGTEFQDKFQHLYGLALAEAEAARDKAGHGLVAGSIGPLAASYRPDIHPEHSEAVAKYSEIAKLLAPKSDVILCETVASLDHARSILEGAKAAGKPIWLAMTVDDEDGTKLRSGERVGDVCDVASKGAAAVLINCSAPEAISVALDDIKNCGLPFGAYANGFRKITKEFLGQKPTVDALKTREDLTPQRYAEYALEWVEMGATIVGGCCEVGPAHIKEIARVLTAAGHRVVHDV